MLKNSLSTLSLSIFAIFICASSFAQEKVQQKVIGENGRPSLVVFSKEASYSMQDVNAVLKEQLKTRNKDKFIQINSRVDNIGFEHQKYQQSYNNIPVEFGTYTLHGKNGKVASISGEYYNIEGVNTTPRINKSQAFQNAINHVGAKSYLWDNAAMANQMNYSKPVGELVLLPNLDAQGKDTSKNALLAYKYDIYATAPISRGIIYVDAVTGDVLFYDSIIKHLDEHANSSKNLVSIKDEHTVIETKAYRATGNAATRYSGTKQITTRVIGSSYALRDNTRGGGINTYNSGRQASYPTTNFTDANNDWTTAEFNNNNKDNAALDAHWGAEKTYDYLSTVHGRNSYNGSGAAINSWVHYDNQPGGAGYDNAFWNGSVMTYGDGSSNGNEGNGNFDALTSLDVAAHEIGHAVTSSTANLAYRRESGGLNEGFSDIWGAAVEHFAKGNGNDGAPAAKVWLIGDEIDRRNGSSALRSMSNPNSRNQPDTYGGSFWKNPNCGTPTQANDYCGVHTNSGVLNYWFYLSVVGGSDTNDIGNTFSVSGIGMTKSAKIAYRTLTQYLSANSTFANARAGAIQSAKDLYGAGGAEEIAVTNAWHAVGVGNPYPTGGGNPGGSTCTSTVTSLPYGESYESSLGAWTQSTADDINWTRDAAGTPSNNTGPSNGAAGSFYMFVEASGNGTGFPNKKAILNSPCYDLSGESAISFDFKYHMYGATDMGTIALEVTKDNGITWDSVWNESGNKGNAWLSASVNLAAYANETIQLRFNRVTGSTWQADVAIDDVKLIAGSAVPGDTVVPVITLVGNASVSLTVGDTYTDQGATATDNVDGNLTSSIVTTGSVNTNTPGIYTLRYNVSDTAGNAATEVVRTVTVSQPVTITYCNSNGNNTNDEYISRVQIGSINKTSAAGTTSTGYSDFTSITTSLSKGASSTIIITPTWTGTIYNEGYSVFIDYNQDGDFTDTGETVWTKSASRTTPVSGSFTIPSNASNGATRMRVAMKYNGVPNSCEAFNYGEVEDYTVNIGVATINNTLIQEAVKAIEISVYPNPVKGNTLFVKTTLKSIPFTVVNMLGQQVAKGTTATNGINVSSLETGLYVIQFSVNNQVISKRFIKE